MDIEAYKSSGILEQYLLGMLSEKEAREVEQIAQTFPEVKAELDAMEDALTQYALGKGIPMPDQLSARIAQRLETLDQEPPSGALQPNAGARGRNILPLMGTLLALAIAAAIFFWFRNSQKDQELNQVQRDLQQFQVQCDEVQRELDQAEVQLAILRSEGNQTYIMRGNENNPGAIANVYYNPGEQRAYLDIRELPPPPNGQQYQLWGIGVAGVQSMNVFDLPEGEGVTFLEVPYLPDVSTFAVSLEPEGGSATPTEVHLISS